MIPTRGEIQEQLNNFIDDPKYVKIGKLGTWLDEMKCPNEDRLKIMSDLETYQNY